MRRELFQRVKIFEKKDRTEAYYKALTKRSLMIFAYFLPMVYSSEIAPEGFIESYGSDATLPALCFFALRNLRLTHNSALTLVTAIPVAVEIAQRFDLYHGVYDPKDFLAYAISSASATLIDRRISRKETEQRRSESS